MLVSAHTRSPWPAPHGDVRWRALPDLLESSDCVVLAGPLTPETRGLIGAQQLVGMRRGSYLINVARGPVVVEDALVQALQSGHLAGAALDVFDTIPVPDDHPYWQMDQVIITPHVAGITGDSMRTMGLAAATAVDHLLHATVPPNCVNPQAVAAFQRRVA